MKVNERAKGHSATLLIDRRIEEVGGWRGKTLARMRALILEADPQRGVDLARTGITDYAAELDRLRRRRGRGIQRPDGGPPEAPTEYVPCGHGSRFGDASATRKLAERRGPSPSMA